MNLKTELFEMRFLPGDFIRVIINAPKIDAAHAVRLFWDLALYGNVPGKNVQLDVTKVEEMHEDGAIALKTFVHLATQPTNPGEERRRAVLLIRNEGASRHWQKALPGMTQRVLLEPTFERVA